MVKSHRTCAQLFRIVIQPFRSMTLMHMSPLLKRTHILEVKLHCKIERVHMVMVFRS